MTRRAIFAMLLALDLSACSGGSGFTPSLMTHQRTATATATQAPTALPGDSSSALPGDTSTALPGGDSPLCAPNPPPGTARCLVAQNLGILPLSLPNAPLIDVKGLHPADLASAYQLPTGAGGGQTVAIVDAYDDPSAEIDLAIYRLEFGLPPCLSLTGCFRKVNQAGAAWSYPPPNQQWATEVSLDLDVVSAVCPNCRILLVEANSASLDDLGASVDRAVALGANVVSNSYDASEWPGELAEDAHFDHPGVPITASSGDGSVPTFPAVSQHVISVGGTTLAKSGGSWIETAWTYDGHGCSYYIWRPAWQPQGPCHNARSTVDIAAVADPQTGVAVYDDFVNSGQLGGWIVVGGTSVGAPLVAGAYALAGDEAANGNASFAYGHPNAFSDLAPVGFDTYTGIGSPRGIGGF
ncbi:MAG: S53 family peptidase [Vulcanimicrobiaceae bacterium]